MTINWKLKLPLILLLILSAISSVSAQNILRFVMIADPQMEFSAEPGIDKDYMRLAIHRINNLHDDSQFVLVLGDMVQGANNLDEWADYNEEIALLQLPYYEVMGNHDGYSSSGLSRWRNDWGKPDYYSFTHQGVYFMALNSYFQKKPNDLPGETATQKSWIHDELSDNISNPHKIIFQHYALYTSDPNEAESGPNIPQSERDFMFDVIDTYQPKAILHGHIHYERVNNYNGTLLLGCNPTSRTLGNGKRGFYIVDYNKNSGNLTYQFNEMTQTELDAFLAGPPPNGAQFLNQTAPTTLNAGETFSAAVSLKNTGMSTWRAADSHRLGAVGDDSTWTGSPRVTLTQDVPPGASHTFYFQITAPATPGTYPFQWRMVQDGVEWFGESSDLINVTVEDGNAAPTFISQPVYAAEVGELYNYAIQTNDIEGDPITLSAVLIPSWLTLSGSSLTGTPQSGDMGPHPIALRASDGNSSNDQLFNISVSAPGNDAPVVSSTPEEVAMDGEPYSYQFYGTDVDGDHLTYSAVSIPAWLSFSGDTLSGTPSTSDIGLHNVSLSMSDGTVLVGHVFNIYVFPVPSASNLVLNPSFENGGTSPVSWNMGDAAVGSTQRSQEGNSSLKMTNASSATTQTIAIEANTDYNISVWIDASLMTTGIAVFDTSDKFDGSGQGQFVMYNANGGWAEYSGSFNSGAETSVTLRMFGSGMVGDVFYDNITIVPATGGNSNLAPEFITTAVVSATEDSAYSYAARAVDAEGDTLSYSSLLTLPAWLTLDAASGLLSGIPRSSDVGDHSLSLEVNDGQGGSDTQNFVITVDPAFHPPVIWETDPVVKVAAEVGKFYGESLLADVSQPSNSWELSFYKTAGPAWLTVISSDGDSGTAGDLLGVPSSGDIGLNVFTVTASSGGPATAATVHITVIGVDGADTDGDGVLDFMEYALGGDPADASDGKDLSPRVVESGSSFNYNFCRNSDELFYYVETSEDLSNWVVDITLPASDSAKDEAVSISLGGAKKFVRLRVSDIAD